jgi:hypothetical protein
MLNLLTPKWVSIWLGPSFSGPEPLIDEIWRQRVCPSFLVD